MNNDAIKRTGELEKMERAVEFGIETLFEDEYITKEQFNTIDKFEVITELSKELLYEEYVPEDLTNTESDAIDTLLSLIEQIIK